VKVVEGKAHLFQIVDASGTGSRFPGSLDGREKEAKESADYPDND
jgi:hypothetical protein